MFKKIIQFFSKKEVQPTAELGKFGKAKAKMAYQVPVLRTGDEIVVHGYIEETQHYICDIPKNNIKNIKIPCRVVTPTNFYDPTVSKVVSISTATEN